MPEYVLIKNGQVQNIVTTSRSLAYMARTFLWCEVRPINEVSELMLREYRYWNERS